MRHWYNIKASCKVFVMPVNDVLTSATKRHGMVSYGSFFQIQQLIPKVQDNFSKKLTWHRIKGSQTFPMHLYFTYPLKCKA